MRKGNMTNVKQIGNNLVIDKMSIKFDVFGAHVEDWIMNNSSSTNIVTPNNRGEGKIHTKFLQKLL